MMPKQTEPTTNLTAKSLSVGPTFGRRLNRMKARTAVLRIATVTIDAPSQR